MSRKRFSAAALESVLNPEDERPTVVILSGLEGSNRLDWCYQYMRKHNIGRHMEKWRAVVERDHRDLVAHANGIPFAETFRERYREPLFKSMSDEMKTISGRVPPPNVIIDAQTLTGIDRERIASFFPDYRFVAVVCLGDEGAIAERLANRPGTKDLFYPQWRIAEDGETLWKQLPNEHQGFAIARIISPDGNVLGRQEIRQMQRARRPEEMRSQVMAL